MPLRHRKHRHSGTPGCRKQFERAIKGIARNLDFLGTGRRVEFQNQFERPTGELRRDERPEGRDGRAGDEAVRKADQGIATGRERGTVDRGPEAVRKGNCDILPPMLFRDRRDDRIEGQERTRMSS